MPIKNILFLLTINYISCDILIQLPDGVINGREDITIENKRYYAFEKIPYASPPVGDLRFKAPIPPEKWDGILNTTHMDVTCYQNETDSDLETEDCLYLSVFTPQLPSDDPDVSLPVMLFIHGGAFVDGSAMIYGQDNFINNDVILVTFNYRLGMFGFLSTEDDIIPGNNGLKDQRLAIKWTHDNIKLFGGDPNKITIFGESAGSASTAYQLLNLNSNGLFRAAICQSGTFLSPWAFQRRARNVAFNVAASLNNTFDANNNSQDLLSFLQSVPARDLDSASRIYLTKNEDIGVKAMVPISWTPVIEVENPEAFITEKMYGLLRDGKIVNATLLIGQNSEESLLFYQTPNELIWELTNYDNNVDKLVPEDMKITDFSQKVEMGKIIKQMYTGGEPFLNHLGDGARYLSDNGFTRPVIKHAEIASKYIKTYYYIFSYDGELGGISAHYDGAESVGHAEELRYLFCRGEECDIHAYPASDIITRDRLVKLWTNFAKYQNPTPEPSELLQNITWPSVSTENGDFLYVDIGEELVIKNHPKEAVYREWIRLYDSLNYDDFDTY